MKLFQMAMAILLLFCGLSSSDSEAASSDPTGSVTVGVYLNGIRSIDLKAGSVNLDLYLWLRSNGPRDLLGSIEIMNGVGSEKTSIVKKRIGNENYYSARIQVTAYQIFDLRKFPLDKQTLKIIIEDSEEDISSLKFVADTENTKVSSAVVLPGWQVGSARITVVPNTYETNYGDPTFGAASSVFSRAIVEVPIEREGLGYFFKLFGTVILSASVAFLSFYIKPDDLDPRFGLGIGGIFAVVASNFVLSSMLPETHQITMGEALLLLTIVAIFVALLESVVSLNLWENGKKSASVTLDSRAGVWMPMLYVGACAAIVSGYWVGSN